MSNELTETEFFNYARSIIDRFARDDRHGTTVLGELLGIGRSSVAYWISSGSIPDKWRQPIIDAGARIGVLVTPFCFVAHLRARELSDAA